MTNLLDLRFWFNLRPEALTPFALKAFAGLLIFFAAAAVVIAIIKHRGGIYRGFLKRLYGFLLSNALIGLLLLFFAYELVPFLSARFWVALWVIIMVIWIVFILRQLRTIPEMKRKQSQEEELKRYLP